MLLIFSLLLLTSLRYSSPLHIHYLLYFLILIFFLFGSFNKITLHSCLACLTFMYLVRCHSVNCSGAPFIVSFTNMII